MEIILKNWLERHQLELLERIWWFSLSAFVRLLGDQTFKCYICIVYLYWLKRKGSTLYRFFMFYVVLYYQMNRKSLCTIQLFISFFPHNFNIFPLIWPITRGGSFHLTMGLLLLLKSKYESYLRRWQMFALDMCQKLEVIFFPRLFIIWWNNWRWIAWRNSTHILNSTTIYIYVNR